MDVSNPSAPKLIGHWADDIDSTHDISINEAGTRACLTRWGNYVPFGLPGTNGLVILDTTDIKNRVASPAQPKTIGTLYCDDGGVARQTHPYTYNGKPFLVFTDETGVSKLAAPDTGRVDACAKGLPPFGFARIIDLSDETKPKLVAKLMLEVNDRPGAGDVGGAGSW